MKLHKSRQFTNRFLGTTTTTLCGRMNAQSKDGMNIADTDNQVTCKFCIRIMAITEGLSNAKV